MIKRIDDVAERLMLHTPEALEDEESAAGRWAAVSAILNPGERGPELLFIKRAASPRDPWSGHMAFPGGRRDPKDASLISTAVRETLEEINLDLREYGRVLGQLDDLPAIGRGKRLPLVIRPFVMAVPRRFPLLLQEAEVERVVYVPLAHLADPSNIQAYTHHRLGEDYTLPSYRVGGDIIWGLTFAMVQSLLHALKLG